MWVSWIKVLILSICLVYSCILRWVLLFFFYPLAVCWWGNLCLSTWQTGASRYGCAPKPLHPVYAIFNIVFVGNADIPSVHASESRSTFGCLMMRRTFRGHLTWGQPGWWPIFPPGSKTSWTETGFVNLSEMWKCPDLHPVHPVTSAGDAMRCFSLRLFSPATASTKPSAALAEMGCIGIEWVISYFIYSLCNHFYIFYKISLLCWMLVCISYFLTWNTWDYIIQSHNILHTMHSAFLGFPTCTDVPKNTLGICVFSTAMLPFFLCQKFKDNYLYLIMNVMFDFVAGCWNVILCKIYISVKSYNRYLTLNILALNLLVFREWSYIISLFFMLIVLNV